MLGSVSGSAAVLLVKPTRKDRTGTGSKQPTLDFFAPILCVVKRRIDGAKLRRVADDEALGPLAGSMMHGRESGRGRREGGGSLFSFVSRERHIQIGK